MQRGVVRCPVTHGAQYRLVPVEDAGHHLGRRSGGDGRVGISHPRDLGYGIGLGVVDILQPPLVHGTKQTGLPVDPGIDRGRRHACAATDVGDRQTVPSPLGEEFESRGKDALPTVPAPLLLGWTSGCGSWIICGVRHP